MIYQLTCGNCAVVNKVEGKAASIAWICVNCAQEQISSIPCDKNGVPLTTIGGPIIGAEKKDVVGTVQDSITIAQKILADQKAKEAAIAAAEQSVKDAANPTATASASLDVPEEEKK